MEPVQNEEVVKKQRGRPRKMDLTGTSFDRASSSASSAPPTPLPSANDALAADELAAFGIASADETLPLPPGYAVGVSNGPLGKRSIDQVTAPGAGRAKRPKNVKFSPAKGAGKTLARRAMPTTSAGLPKPSAAADGDTSLPNNDYCDSCSGKGQFLCCDGGCLRSFHFNCLEPPLDIDDVPDEDWYCKACTAARDPPPKPPRGFFRELLYRIDLENPKAFTLTPEIKNHFLHVATGPAGEFIDSTEHRPPSKITGRAIGQEDRDGYRLKDKTGNTILCYRCNEAASIPKQRRIISCDFCEMHWHLDCLDPPMTGMPPPTRKWMCPVHSDLDVPKKRQPKQTQTVNVTDPYEYNNGDIIILPRREPPRIMEEYDEIVVNRVRYQVPEETVILDFWGRVQGKPKTNGLLPHPREQFSREYSPISMDSPLTSLGDLSDADPPEVAEHYLPRKSSHHYSSNGPYPSHSQPHYHYQSQPPPPPQPLDFSALDALAELADGLLNDDPSGSYRRAVEPPAPASSSHPRTSSNGLTIKLQGRFNGSSGDRVNGGPFTMNDDFPSRSGLDKGKGKARENGPDSGTDYQPLGHPSGRGAEDPRKRQSSGSRHLAGGALPSDPRYSSQSKSPVERLKEFPSSSSRSSGVRHGRRQSGNSGSSSSPPLSVSSEIAVQSRDDLKALMHVRKLVSTGVTDRRALLGFIEGEAIVPKLAFIKEDSARQPWDLPWEGESFHANSNAGTTTTAIDEEVDGEMKMEVSPGPEAPEVASTVVPSTSGPLLPEVPTVPVALEI